MSDPSERPPDEDDRLDTALERGLRRHPLDESAFARIRAGLDPEFVRLIRRARRARLMGWGALAATVAAVSILSVSIISDVRPAPVVAKVERVAGAGLTVSALLVPHEASVGAELRAAEHWVARGPVLLTLSNGVTMRLAPGAIIDALRQNRMKLEAGRVYLDFGADTTPFSLETPAGPVEHVGTQFEAAILGSDTRVRVREGQVRVSTGHGLESGERGTEILFSASGAVRRSTIPTYGKDWEWVESISPSFAIDNRSLLEFLQWVGRETGRRIDFADMHVQAVASQTILHGSVEGFAPLEALDHVMNTTSLRFEVQGDAIRVSSRR
jgi:ferric-dicitrate binding protein FerR (iron transport regulator)